VSSSLNILSAAVALQNVVPVPDLIGASVGTGVGLFEGEKLGDLDGEKLGEVEAHSP